MEILAKLKSGSLYLMVQANGFSVDPYINVFNVIVRIRSDLNHKDGN